MMIKLFFTIALFFVCISRGFAQDFEIRKYDLNATVNPAGESVAVTARMKLVNLSSPDLADNLLLSNEKPRFQFFLNARAKAEKMTVNGAAVPLKTAEDPRNNLLRVYTDITVAIATARELEVELTYAIPGADRSASLHVSSGESYLLPASFWVPVIHTPYADHGADTAPFTLNVSAPANLKLVSSGIRKSDTAFEQSMAAQPFFIVGDYEVTRRGGDAYPIEVYAPRGLDETGKRQVERIAAEAERIVAFHVRYFGVAALAPFRIIATQARQLSTSTSDNFAAAREISFATVGAATIDDNLLRRDLLDLGTIELLAGAPGLTARRCCAGAARVCCATRCRFI
jgi:hypothetical protein